MGNIQIEELDPTATLIDESGNARQFSELTNPSTVEPLVVADNVHNILLIGQDSTGREYSQDGTGSRSDIIMILTINETDSTLKLTSIQRDCYAYIPGYSKPQKINAAMAYGGPQLLIMTLENQLRIDLEQYAYVDMSHMEKVINAIGGIDINVTNKERTSDGGLNDLIAQQNVMAGDPISANKLYDSGLVTLNGRQAVAYARIRKMDDDYQRSSRQVTVLKALLERFMSLGVTKKLSVSSEILKLISTNVTPSEIESYLTGFLPKLSSAKIELLQLPVEGYANENTYSDIVKGEWSIRPNWNGMIPIVQEFIFGQTHSFDPVLSIPKAPSIIPTPTPEADITSEDSDQE